MPAGLTGVRVQVGIDAAITSNHHVCVRQVGVDGAVVTSRFVVPPTLAGLSTLTKRIACYPGVVAVAEPTSMSWLPLAAALTEASGQLALVGSGHAARLRGAITGKNKSDVIDADVPGAAAGSSAGSAGAAPGLHPPRRGSHRWQPLSAPADLAGPVGLSGCVAWFRRFAGHRQSGAVSLAAP
ncbi:MAG: IS110 family transposase [Actinomycetota bacterium]|nr:IS110 family transposase [Actinomycetota bacterium]